MYMESNYNLWGTFKPVLRRKFRTLKVYNRKKKVIKSITKAFSLLN